MAEERECRRGRRGRIAVAPAHIWPTLRPGGVVQVVDRQRQIGEGSCGHPSCVDEGFRDLKSLESRWKTKGKELCQDSLVFETTVPR